MKHDFDLIREILLEVERSEPERLGTLHVITPRDFSGTEAQNYHHIRMLVDRGLLEPAGRPTMQAEFAIHGLAFDGHDFLDAIRDRTVGDVTKDRLREAGGWTFDSVLAVAKEELKRRLAHAGGG